MKPLGKKYKDAEATRGSFERLPAGGYVCKIVEAVDCPIGFNSMQPEKGEYIALVYDIAEGPYKDYYNDDFGKKYKSAHTYYASYKDTNFGRFKGMLTAIDESNGTTFVAQAENGLKEQQLVGKILGVVLGEEEYNSDYGYVRVSLKARYVCSADKIRKGEFKVPELKKLKESTTSKSAPTEGFTPLGDEDLPF